MAIHARRIPQVIDSVRILLQMRLVNIQWQYMVSIHDYIFFIIYYTHKIFNMVCLFLEEWVFIVSYEYVA